MNYLWITMGTGLMAFAISSIYDPAGMVTGGFSGIAIILKELSRGWVDGGIPLGLTTYVLNIPLFLVAVKIKGKKYLVKTIYATTALSVWLSVLPVFHVINDDMFLSALFGGILSGVGIGLVFLGQGTTGGTDLVAALIQRRFKHYSIAKIMQVVDGAVVLVGVWLFGIPTALYAVVAIYLVTKVSDGIVEGLNFSKAAFIITQEPKKVSDCVLEELNRGITGIFAKGMYSGEEKEMLFCVVSKKEIVQLKELVLKIDSGAFVIITDVREVLGEGFIEKVQ